MSSHARYKAHAHAWSKLCNYKKKKPILHNNNLFYVSFIVLNKSLACDKSQKKRSRLWKNTGIIQQYFTFNTTWKKSLTGCASGPLQSRNRVRSRSGAAPASNIAAPAPVTTAHRVTDHTSVDWEIINCVTRAETALLQTS